MRELISLVTLEKVVTSNCKGLSNTWMESNDRSASPWLTYVDLSILEIDGLKYNLLET